MTVHEFHVVHEEQPITLFFIQCITIIYITSILDSRCKHAGMTTGIIEV